MSSSRPAGPERHFEPSNIPTIGPAHPYDNSTQESNAIGSTHLDVRIQRNDHGRDIDAAAWPMPLRSWPRQ